MSLVQILAIWGAASAAFFSTPVHAGEWENYKELKEALVRSDARRDLPLPRWASSLDYQRSYHFWDVQNEALKHDSKESIKTGSNSPSDSVSDVRAR